MRWHHYLITLALVATLAIPATPAGIFGRRIRPGPSPTDRVQELLTLVRVSPDDRKRTEATVELRQYDPTTYPEIVPALADVLRNDRSAAVRIEAAQTLGRLRPVSQMAGQALETAASHDASMRVRWQARSSLVSYHLGGYHAGKTKDPEGPALTPGTDPSGKVIITVPQPAVPAQPPTVTVVPQPPAAAPSGPAVDRSQIARPLPQGPAQPPLPATNTAAMPAAPFPVTSTSQRPIMVRPAPSMQQKAPAPFPFASPPQRTTAPIPVTSYPQMPAQPPVTAAPPRSAEPPLAPPASEEGPVLAPPS